MAPRRKRNLVDAVLANSASAVAVLDADRRLRHFSPGMESQTGWSADKIEGLVCDPSVPETPTPVDLLASALSPSRDVLTGEPQSVNAVLPTSAGGLLKTRLTFFPVSDEDNAVSRILVISSDDQHGSQPQASLSQKLHAEITALRLEFRRRFADSTYIGGSPDIRKALDQAELLKDSYHGYCISGPDGSGRRHLARLIHVGGQQNEHSFMTLDCRLLTGQQLLSTLHELRQLAADRSAASHQKAGTLALNDIDQCPREVQQWFLDNLTEEVEGVRLVGMATVTLQQAEASGWLLPQFANLFSTLQLQIPSLHGRGNDIELLAQHFVEHCRRSLETSAETLSQEVLDQLKFYRWPGNVRELRRVIVDACQNSFETELTLEDLPFAFRAGLEAQQIPSVPEETETSLEQLLQKFERDVLLKTLAACRGNKADAARRLGMTRPRLYRRLKTLEIETDD